MNRLAPIALIAVALCILVPVMASEDADADTTYTLTFDLRGGSIGPDDMSATSSASSHTFTIPYTVPTRSGGWQFMYWSASSGGTYDPGDTITLTSSEPNVTMSAMWRWSVGTTYTYTITFDDNGGSGGPADLSFGPTIETAYTFNIPNTVPTRTGYTFLYWDSDVNERNVYPGGALTVGSDNPDVVLTAVWQRNVTTYNYTLSFDANGGSGAPGTMTYTTSATSHTFTIPSTVPTRSGGWEFSHWSASSGGTYDPGDTITLTSSRSSVTLSAVWSEATRTFILTFDDNGGSGGPGQLTYGPTTDTSHSFTIPSTVPTWEGRDFLGWSFAANGEGTLLQPGESLRLDGSGGGSVMRSTLYASWTDGGYIYTLDFDANGGSGAPGKMTSDPTQESYYIWTIPNTVPTWEGHQFMGWATSPNASDPELYYHPGGRYEVEARYDRNATLYAIWEDAPTTTYIVYFNANGGSGAPSTINSGAISTIQYEVTIPSTVPTRSGYQFLGWSDSADSDSATWQPGDSFYLLPTGASTVTITLYAVWANSYTYTITFDAIGGSGGPGQLIYGPTTDTSHTFTLPTTVPTSSDPDLEFAGWSIYPSGEGSLWQPGEQYTVTAADSSDVTETLYASWARIAWEFSLSFVAPGATNIPEDMHSGRVDTPYYTFTIPSNVPAKDGWTFTGWDAAGGASGIFQPGEEITVTAPTVLYAEFDSVGYEYTLSFDGNGTTQLVPNPLNSPLTADGSYTFTIPQSHPIWDGHDFEGWALSPDGSPDYQPGGTITLYAPDYDQTLYAIWVSSVETEVHLIGPSVVSVGDTLEITASVLPEGSGGVTWLRVSGGDLIDDVSSTSTTWTATAIAAGSVTIRATATDGSGAVSDITIQIMDVPIVDVVTVQMAGSTSVQIGETRTLSAVVLPSDLGDRSVIWTVTSGSDLITYETVETWRGGELTYEAIGAGTVTITAASVADPDAMDIITITITAASSEDSEAIGPEGIIQVIGDALFDGNASIAGVVLFAIILGVLFAIIREPLPVVLLGIPIMGVFTLLGLLDMNMVILLIIVTAVGLALIARNMWRD